MAPQWLFESFRLDPVNACLWRGTAVVPLQPKVFDLLHYLVTHPHRLVRKDELLEAVWPATAVSDAVIRMAVGALRQALDDSAQMPRCIATVPRRGYRFIAAVTPVEPPPPLTPRPEVPLGLGRPLTPQSARVPLVLTPPILGEPSPLAPTAPASERKQVTVLCADIPDAMARIRTLDPEAAQHLLDPILQRMIDAVHHYEGTVNQMLGDGLMALFGAPVAQEDHALRACYAALAMQAALRACAGEVHRAHGLTVQVRVGLNAGEVVVRPRRHDGQLGYSAVGVTTHLATRMAQLARPGTIVLTAATVRLVEGLVQVTALGPVPVTGLPEPLMVYELRDVSAVHGRFQAAAARGLTPLVGREVALASVRPALARAATGQGQVVAVLGEAGLGKSRLVYECLQALEPQRWQVLTTAARSYMQATPYFPVLTLLKQSFHLDDGMLPTRLQATLTAQIQALDPRLQDAIPAFLALLDALPDDMPFRQLDPTQRRTHMLDALKRWLVHLCQRQPVLLVVEDLHWLDTETQTWLDRLVDSVPALPLLLLVTYRPTYQHQWSNKTYYTHVRLDPLPPSSSIALIQAVLGKDASLTPLLPLLNAHTEGNPFFLEESLRTLIETQALVGTPGAYRLTQTLPALPVPATVQAVLAARIDRLLPAEKQVLQTAAVIGMDVPLPVLHAVMARPVQALHQSLTALQAAEFLYETQLFPEPVYTFKHALTQQVAAQSVLRSARQALHQQIATVLATQFPSVVDTQPERLAHHYTEAGHGAPAVGYWQRAGQRALDHAAPVAAITHLRRGLDVLATLPETTASLHHELALQVALGAAWTQTSGWAAPEVGQAYARARELGQSLGAFPQLFAALLGQCVRSMQMADLPAAHTVATHLFTLAQQHAEPVVRLAAHTTRGATLFYRGEVAAAHAQLTQASLLDVPPSHHALGVYHRFELGVVARCYRAMSLWFLGTPDQAWRQMSQAYALAQELAQPYDLAFALIWMARLQQWRRDVPAILTSTECLVALTAEHGFGQYGSWARMLRGWALVAQGQGDEGLDQMRQGMTAYEALGATLSRPYYLALLAEGYSLMGAAETSLELLAEALAIMQHTEDRVWEAEIHRLQGLVRRQAHPSHTAPAEAAVQQTLAVARRQQAKSLELRAAMSLSRLWQQQGKSAEARELLAPLYGWFTEGFDTADLQEAKALLDELGG